MRALKRKNIDKIVPIIAAVLIVYVTMIFMIIGWNATMSVMDVITYGALYSAFEGPVVYVGLKYVIENFK